MHAARHDRAVGVDVEQVDLAVPRMRRVLARIGQEHAGAARREHRTAGPVLLRPRERHPAPEFGRPAARPQYLFPAPRILARLDHRPRRELQRRRVAIAQRRGALEELDQLFPLRRRSQPLVGFGRRVAVAGDDQPVHDLELQHFRKIVPVDPLRVGRDLDHRHAPALLRDLGDDRGELAVQQRLAEVEQPQRVDAFDVDVRQTQREIVDRDPLDLRFERRIGAADATQLAAVDDVKMDRVDVPGLKMRHVGSCVTSRG